jgi:hypothetical protein
VRLTCERLSCVQSERFDVTAKTNKQGELRCGASLCEIVRAQGESASLLLMLQLIALRLGQSYTMSSPHTTERLWIVDRRGAVLG